MSETTKPATKNVTKATVEFANDTDDAILVDEDPEDDFDGFEVEPGEKLRREILAGERLELHVAQARLDRLVREFEALGFTHTYADIVYYTTEFVPYKPGPALLIDVLDGIDDE